MGHFSDPEFVTFGSNDDPNSLRKPHKLQYRTKGMVIQMKKRFLSMLLVLVMVIGMIPFSALSASADQSTASTSGTTVEVTTWDELKTALSGSADATVIVKQKIEKTLNNASESGISCTGNKTLVLENDVIVTVQNSILEGSYFDGIITIGVSGNLTIKGSGSFLGKIDAGYLAADGCAGASLTAEFLLLAIV